MADAGPDQTLTDADGNGVEGVTLDGTASFDANANIVSYEWTEGGTLIAPGANPPEEQHEKEGVNSEKWSQWIGLHSVVR